jgi:hypothetical protein
MAEEVHLPGGTEASKKWLIYGGSAAGLYVMYRWYAARKASAAAAAAGPTALPVDTSNTSAGQGDTGFANPDPNAGPSSFNSTALTTNSAWSSKVESDLVNLGYDAQTVATAIGLYLSQQPLALDQANIVRVAWAMDGKPPESPNLAILPAQTPPTGGGTTTPPPSGGGTTTPPPDPHANQHWQNPQVATLSKGHTLRQLATGLHYSATQLNTLVQLNPGEGGPDHPATTTHLIRTSDGRWVPN